MSEWSELFEKWRVIVAEIDPEIGAPELWADEPPDYFLHVFRPDGRGIERLFEDLPEAAPALERLARIFTVAGPETGHAYFIPHRERRHKRSDEELVGLANDHFDRLAKVARRALDETDEDDQFLLSSSRNIAVHRGLPPEEDPDDYTSLLSRVYEIVTEWASPWHELVNVLTDPLYMLACSYQLCNWVLWPLDKDEPERCAIDPYAPWFDIWAAGASLHYQRAKGENQVLIVAPRPLSH